MTKLAIGMVCFLGAAIAVACGSSTEREIFDPNGDGGTSSSSGSSGASSSSGMFGGDAAATPPCVGLACQQVSCGSGTTTTSVSGIVLDPAGKNPVYNVVVYVPNGTPDAIKHGPVCDSCGGAPVSGNPLVTTLTDATGHFQLNDVPVMANLPLVLQIGKWRRQITVATAPTKCQDNPVTDTDSLRLPKNQTEGDMPLIALTSGCDPIHTLVQKIGVDPAEFTSGTGTGMVHVYQGQDSPGVVTGATDAYAFWGNLTEMMRYDIIINECECSPYARDTKGPAYANMDQYLDSGGRVFNSHYHLNFFGASSENGGKEAAELNSAADWTLWSESFGSSSSYKIDTTFPKGVAMDDWLDNLKTASKWGPSIKTTAKGTINVSSVGDIKAAKTGLSQQWIYTADNSSVAYLSINTPTAQPAANRCGRAVATDMHVANGSTTTMTEQEAALEFMFFDLASCVVDDSTTPTPPPVN